jgi:hypothetical protein
MFFYIRIFDGPIYYIFALFAMIFFINLIFFAYCFIFCVICEIEIYLPFFFLKFASYSLRIKIVMLLCLYNEFYSSVLNCLCNLGDFRLFSPLRPSFQKEFLHLFTFFFPSNYQKNTIITEVDFGCHNNYLINVT